MAKKRICVIGAGPSGLAAIKCCKDDGFDVTCFEKDEIGGLWRYRDTDNDGLPSVMKTTIINTSKENSAYSDFPPPKELPNFMHHSLLLEYFEMYAKHFDLRQNIIFHHEVSKVEKAEDYEDTGRWVVTVRDLVHESSSRTEVFDGVMICTGHHIYPNVPYFMGLKDFQGEVLHTHSLKTADNFKNLRVLVIGIGNSGVDAAVELSLVTKQVYLSTRRGSWIASRVSFQGQPLDIIFNSRMFQFALKWDIFGLFEKIIEFYFNIRFDHKMYQLKPDHGIFSAHPTINDALPNSILSGRVIIKQDVDRFEKTGVVFRGEDDMTEVDAVVLATGYHIKYSFLDDSVLQIKENKLRLYKMIFPPSLSHTTLAFIGLVQPLGCIFPIAEAQGRWFSYIMKNNIKLPSREEMEKEIDSRLSQIEKTYVLSARHTIQVDYVSYMDEICSQFGAKPNLWKLFFTDPKLFWACFYKSCVSYQYRLHGPNAWADAREAILTVDERITAPLNTRLQ